MKNGAVKTEACHHNQNRQPNQGAMTHLAKDTRFSCPQTSQIFPLSLHHILLVSDYYDC